MGVGVPLQGHYTPSSLVESFSAPSDNSTHEVHIAAVSCGSNITGVLNLIKSAVLFNDKTTPVHFHVFSDSFSEVSLHKQVTGNVCV